MFDPEFVERHVAPVADFASDGIEYSFELGEVLVPFDGDDIPSSAQIAEDDWRIECQWDVGLKGLEGVVSDLADKAEPHIVVHVLFMLS